jgi:hypothetical protein
VAATSIKLLWLPGPGYYDLRVMAGQSSRKRDFVGQLRLKPDVAAVFRGLLLAGDAELGDLVVSEVGWPDPMVP